MTGSLFTLPPALLLACARLGMPPTRFVLVVNISRQSAALFEKPRARAAGARRHILAKTFRCSTSKFGVGETAGSNRTPRGLHRIAEKIGGGWPVGTVFRGRKPAGFTWRGKPAATITSRILWLEGLEPGLNRGGQVDSHARYIYIHGTGNEGALGRPDSHGCVHLAADDLIPLYDKVPAGTLVWMAA
ncbi:MAG: L,D-transpeptidase [Verrucomicrobiota bacterium]|jgi:lipoprotein-anchoring transpeptidase ErfK/SrfK